MRLIPSSSRSPPTPTPGSSTISSTVFIPPPFRSREAWRCSPSALPDLGYGDVLQCDDRFASQVTQSPACAGLFFRARRFHSIVYAPAPRGLLRADPLRGNLPNGGAMDRRELRRGLAKRRPAAIAAEVIV